MGTRGRPREASHHSLFLQRLTSENVGFITNMLNCEARELHWLLPATVSAMHQRLLAEHGGLPGVREPGGLESALARPRHLFAYGDPAPDLPALAAAYSGGLIRNHPFVDGNKRAGFTAALTFLRLHGWTIDVTQDEAYAATVSLTTRAMTDDDFAGWLRAHLTPRQPGPR